MIYFFVENVIMMKRYALCIGNDGYEILPKLNCAIADAESVNDMLASLDFDVELFKNLDNELLTQKLSSFSDKLEEDYYDAILLYYVILFIIPIL